MSTRPEDKLLHGVRDHEAEEEIPVAKNERTHDRKGSARTEVVPESVPARRRGRPPRTQVEPQQMVALRMRLEGRTRKEIAEFLGVDQKTISRWFQEPAVQRELAVHLASASAEISAWMASVMPEVVATLHELLQSPDDRIRVKVAFSLVDRVLAVGRQLEGDARILAPMPSSMSGLLEVAPEPEPEGGEVA